MSCSNSAKVAGIAVLSTARQWQGKSQPGLGKTESWKTQEVGAKKFPSIIKQVRMERGNANLNQKKPCMNNTLSLVMIATTLTHVHIIRYFHIVWLHDIAAMKVAAKLAKVYLQTD